MDGIRILLLTTLCPCMSLLQGTNNPSTGELLAIITQLNQTIHAQNKKIAALETTVTTQNKMVAVLESTTATQSQKIGLLENTLYNQSKIISSLEASRQSSQVAFYTTLTTQKQLGDLQTIEFDNVITNLGNGYDVRHGHFTAPRNGIYTFAAGVMSTSNDLHVQIEKNGVEIGRIYSDTNGQNNAVNVVFVQLNAGDMVWVRHKSGVSSQVIHGDNYCFFGGVLNVSL